MKKVVIIYFDLTFPAVTLQAVTQRIKSLGPWARIGNSAYLVATQYNPVQIRDHVWAAMQQGDTLFVSTCPAPSAWYGLPPDVGQWLRDNQKR